MSNNVPRLVLRKGVKYPVGTIREWGGYVVKKVGQKKWAKIGQRSNEKEMGTRRSLANEKDVAHSLRLIKKMYARRPEGKGEELPIASKADLQKILTKTTYALISAGRNPNIPADMALSDEQIDARQEQLKATLKSKGYIITSGKGSYGAPEDSVIVMAHDADREEVMGIGQQFNQDAIIFSQAGKNQMIYTTGENRGARHEGSGIEWLPKETEDFYTEVKAGGKKVKFTLNFDFDNLVKSIMNWLGLKL